MGFVGADELMVVCVGDSLEELAVGAVKSAVEVCVVVVVVVVVDVITAYVGVVKWVST